MSMKEKIKGKLKKTVEVEESVSITELAEDASYRHAIDIVLESGKYYLVVVKYHPVSSTSVILNKVDLGSIKASALHKAGFILGDKVLRNIDIKPEFLRSK